MTTIYLQSHGAVEGSIKSQSDALSSARSANERADFEETKNIVWQLFKWFLAIFAVFAFSVLVHYQAQELFLSSLRVY